MREKIATSQRPTRVKRHALRTTTVVEVPNATPTHTTTTTQTSSNTNPQTTTTILCRGAVIPVTSGCSAMQDKLTVHAPVWWPTTTPTPAASTQAVQAGVVRHCPVEVLHAAIQPTTTATVAAVHRNTVCVYTGCLEGLLLLVVEELGVRGVLGVLLSPRARWGASTVPGRLTPNTTHHHATTRRCQRRRGRTVPETQAAQEAAAGGARAQGGGLEAWVRAVVRVGVVGEALEHGDGQ